MNKIRLILFVMFMASLFVTAGCGKISSADSGSSSFPSQVSTSAE